MKCWLIIRDRWVIERIVWDGEAEYQYPNPHDEMIEDVNGNVGIGAYYDPDGVFYMPLSTPPGLPEELQ